LIPHFRESINSEDKIAISSAIAQNLSDKGKAIKVFEKQFANWVGCSEDGVVVSNINDALLLALKIIEVTSGDEIILPSYSSEALLLAVVRSGAKPVLCDIGPNWVIEPSNVEGLINKNTKAILVPHAYGIFADVNGFKKYRVTIIEVSSEAVGDKEIDKIEGDLAVFSFGLTECLTTIKGGMILTGNKEWGLKARHIRDEESLSLFTDMQAALGISQLNRYSLFLEKRRKIAGKYLANICKISQRLINFEAKSRSMYLGVPLRIPGGIEKYSLKFAEKGIQITRGIDNLNHRLMNVDDKKFPVSVDLFNNTISLPIYPTLTDEELDICLDSLSILKN
jgi:dTDP-4-amino-4,6-dideoxygalactose transaminase